MEKRLSYLIDLLIEKDKVISEQARYYAELSEEYNRLKRETDGNTVGELKNEIHNLKIQLERLEFQYDDLKKENDVLSKNTQYFESYDAARRYIVDRYKVDEKWLKDNNKVEEFFAAIGEHVVINVEN